MVGVKAMSTTAPPAAPAPARPGEKRPLQARAVLCHPEPGVLALLAEAAYGRGELDSLGAEQRRRIPCPMWLTTCEVSKQRWRDLRQRQHRVQMQDRLEVCRRQGRRGKAYQMLLQKRELRGVHGQTRGVFMPAKLAQPPGTVLQAIIQVKGRDAAA